MFSFACTRLYNPQYSSVGQSETFNSFGVNWRILHYCLSPYAWFSFLGSGPKGLMSCRTQEPPRVQISPLHCFKSALQLSNLPSTIFNHALQESNQPSMYSICSPNPKSSPQALVLLSNPEIRTSENSPLCSTGYWPFEAAALLSLHFFTGSLPPGHWLLLTMCDPWIPLMTSCMCIRPCLIASGFCITAPTQPSATGLPHIWPLLFLLSLFLRGGEFLEFKFAVNAEFHVFNKGPIPK